ncbi:MAG TPA: 2-oxoacid:ferredoxin oxidoreductase subunit gamma [Anaerolineae bacterium]|nr:2-oxoacid:ferredoxin oxidoreductase subunit gamma [Anaerolineae bacterium]
MQTEIIISGFGGQGALFVGQVLAYAGMDQGKHVTWFPSYGPEMRGGTAHCTVIISDDPVGSPLVRCPQVAVVLNLPSMDKYEPLVQPGGVLLYNSSLIDRPSQRTDIRVVPVPANDVAAKLGSARLANMVMLGALVAATAILPLEAVEQALINHLPERHRHFLEPNREALRRGAALAGQRLAPT